NVIEFPFVTVDYVRQLARGKVPRRSERCGGGDPTLVVDRAVPGHLEILRAACRRRILIRLIKCVGHAHAFNRPLRNTFDRVRSFQARGFEDRRGDIDDMMELRANGTYVLDMTGP